MQASTVLLHCKVAGRRVDSSLRLLLRHRHCLARSLGIPGIQQYAQTRHYYQSSAFTNKHWTASQACFSRYAASIICFQSQASRALSTLPPGLEQQHEHDHATTQHSQKSSVDSSHIVDKYVASSAALTSVNSNSDIFYRILDTFPDGIQMAFAYGSGVYMQAGHKDMSTNMLDFILVVDDPLAWHCDNLKRNSTHYSFVKYLGHHGVAYLQEGGAGVYFNTMVPFENRVIKYGVIRTERLITDLLDWDTLYCSGRMHKPVKLLIQPTNTDLIQALQVNLHSAVHAALLLCPEDFTEEELYFTIAGLSYNGDFRMMVGEDRNKVSNIVKPNMEHFRKLYGGIVEAEVHVDWDQKSGQLAQDPNHITQFHHLQLLPKTVLMLLQENRTRPGSHPDIEEVLKLYAHSSHCDDVVSHCIGHIVWRSSLGQSAKTILTAGAQRSLIYSFRKLLKMWKGGMKQMIRLKTTGVKSNVGGRSSNAGKHQDH